MRTNASPLLRRHGEEIEGVIGCYDRIVITATLLDVAYPAAVRTGAPLN